MGRRQEGWPPQKTTRHKEQSLVFDWVKFKAGFQENPPVPKERMKFLRWECSLCEQWTKSAKMSFDEAANQYHSHRADHDYSPRARVTKVYSIFVPV